MKRIKVKEKQMLGKNEISIVRSSAAEYLTFDAAGGSSETSVEICYVDGNIWLTQRMMAALYDVSVSSINQYLKRIFADNELERGTTRLSRTTRSRVGQWMWNVLNTAAT